MFVGASHCGTGGDMVLPFAFRRRYQPPVARLSATEAGLPNTMIVDATNPFGASSRNCARQASTKQTLQIKATREKNTSIRISLRVK